MFFGIQGQTGPVLMRRFFSCAGVFQRLFDFDRGEIACSFNEPRPYKGSDASIYFPRGGAAAVLFQSLVRRWRPFSDHPLSESWQQS